MLEHIEGKYVFEGARFEREAADAFVTNASRT